MVSGQQHAPAVLYRRDRPGTYCTGGWVGPRVGLDGRKISSPLGFFFFTTLTKTISSRAGSDTSSPSISDAYVTSHTHLQFHINRVTLITHIRRPESHNFHTNSDNLYKMYSSTGRRYYDAVTHKIPTGTKLYIPCDMLHSLGLTLLERSGQCTASNWRFDSGPSSP